MFQAVDRCDVGVIESREQLCFPSKTGESFGIMCKRFRQNLDGYVAPELGVVRLIHFSHAASANLREDFVRAELCATRESP